MPSANKRPSGGDIDGRVEEVVVLLLGRYGFSRCLGCSPWSFALDLATLAHLGVDEEALRVAMTRGLVITRPELKAFPEEGGELTSLGWHAQTRFTLTATGAELAWQRVGTRLELGADKGKATARRQDDGEPGLPSGDGPRRDAAGTERSCRKPRWERHSRSLWLGETLLLRFRREAPNQMRILDAFQELHWPARIDDPLPPHGGVDRRERLHDAAKNLNGGQRPWLICFVMELDGQGLSWSPIEDQEPETPANFRLSSDDLPLTH